MAQTFYVFIIWLIVSFLDLSAWGNLGNVLKSQGEMEKAEQAYRNALYYRSNMADMLYNLWVAFVVDVFFKWIMLICLWSNSVSVDISFFL